MLNTMPGPLAPPEKFFRTLILESSSHSEPFRPPLYENHGKLFFHKLYLFCSWKQEVLPTEPRSEPTCMRLLERSMIDKTHIVYDEGSMCPGRESNIWFTKKYGSSCLEGFNLYWYDLHNLLMFYGELLVRSYSSLTCQAVPIKPVWFFSNCTLAF